MGIFQPAIDLSVMRRVQWVTSKTALTANAKIGGSRRGTSIAKNRAIHAGRGIYAGVAATTRSFTVGGRRVTTFEAGYTIVLEHT